MQSALQFVILDLSGKSLPETSNLTISLIFFDYLTYCGNQVRSQFLTEGRAK